MRVNGLDMRTNRGEHLLVLAIERVEHIVVEDAHLHQVLRRRQGVRGEEVLECFQLQPRVSLVLTEVHSVVLGELLHERAEALHLRAQTLGVLHRGAHELELRDHQVVEDFRQHRVGLLKICEIVGTDVGPDPIDRLHKLGRQHEVLDSRLRLLVFRKQGGELGRESACTHPHLDDQEACTFDVQRNDGCGKPARKAEICHVIIPPNEAAYRGVVGNCWRKNQFDIVP
ncbi:MAG: hypothetical protein JWO40_96 [Candidatus Doudnabacteria bacterium]|nr:hypothetical protein [Candidatus Doudnabacteria bacterium]